MPETFDFETLVDRSNSGNLKQTLTPMALQERDLIGFAGAEMDFPTAPAICQAVAGFALRGIYGFTLQDRAYNDAVIWWMQNSRGCAVKAEEIVVSLGTIFALGTAVRAFSAENEGVILQKPVYYRYDNIIERNNRKVVENPLIRKEDGSYRIDFEDLEAKMARDDVKILVMCNPHNPTSTVFGLEEQRRVAELAGKYHVVVFSDEIFADVVFDRYKVEPYFSVDESWGISCTSLGKAFNFTGVNHSNVLIRSEKLRQAYTCQRNKDHFGSIDPFFYQAVLAGYSPEGLAWVKAMSAYVERNYNEMKALLPQCVEASPLEGSFISWLDFRALGLKGGALDAFLLGKAQLVLDSGWEYGELGQGFARINLACPRRFLVDAIGRLRKACSELK